MKKSLISFMCVGLVVSTMAAYQYETKGNQGWLTFDSETTVAFDLTRSGKDKDHENFVDRGQGVSDYGWYNLDTGTSGSFKNGLSATFSENDRIGLYVTDNQGNTYLSTKPRTPFEDDTWGKAKHSPDCLKIQQLFLQPIHLLKANHKSSFHHPLNFQQT